MRESQTNTEKSYDISPSTAGDSKALDQQVTTTNVLTDLLDSATDLFEDVVKSGLHIVKLVSDLKTGNFVKGIEDAQQVFQDIQSGYENVVEIAEEIGEIKNVVEEELQSDQFKDLKSDVMKSFEGAEEFVSDIKEVVKTKDFSKLPETIVKDFNEEAKNVQNLFETATEVVKDFGKNLIAKESPALPAADEQKSKIPDDLKVVAKELLDKATHADTKSAEGISTGVNNKGAGQALA